MCGSIRHALGKREQGRVPQGLEVGETMPSKDCLRRDSSNSHHGQSSVQQFLFLHELDLLRSLVLHKAERVKAEVWRETSK